MPSHDRRSVPRERNPWPAIIAACVFYAAVFCLMCALGAQNPRGEFWYGIATIVTGVVLKILTR